MNRFTSQLQALLDEDEQGHAPGLHQMVEIIHPTTQTNLFRAIYGTLDLIGQRDSQTRLKVLHGLMKMSDLEMNRFISRFER